MVPVAEPRQQVPNSKLQAPKKHQVPNTKHQAPNSREAPSSKRWPRFGAWNLGFLWCLELGFWCFDFRSQVAQNLICARRGGDSPPASPTSVSRIHAVETNPHPDPLPFTKGEGNLRWHRVRITEQVSEIDAHLLSPLGAGRDIKVRGASDCILTAELSMVDLDVAADQGAGTVRV